MLPFHLTAAGWAWTPETVGAIATGGATLLAAWAALLATREARSRRLQQVRAQAERISAWADWVVPTDSADGPTFVLHVANESTLPITNVRVIVHPTDYELDPEGARRFIPILAPGQSKTTKMTYLQGATEVPRSHQELPAMSFRDAQGNRWYRDGVGKLAAHKPGTAPAFWMDAESHPDDSMAVGWGID